MSAALTGRDSGLPNSSQSKKGFSFKQSVEAQYQKEKEGEGGGDCELREGVGGKAGSRFRQEKEECDRRAGASVKARDFKADALAQFEVEEAARAGAREASAKVKAAIAAKSFWAEVPGKQIGNVDVTNKAASTVRLFGANIKQVKVDNAGVQQRLSINEMRDMNKALNESHSDIFCMVDTGLEDGTASSQAKLWTAGMAAVGLKDWGGEKQTWVHSEGPKNGRGRSGGAGLA
jgi:hypothetical protein